MKKNKFLKATVLLLFLNQSYAQMVVSDPKATAEAVRNGIALEKQYKIAESALEKLEKVNSTLQQAKIVLAIKNNLQSSVVMIGETPALIQKVHPKLRNTFYNRGNNNMLEVGMFQEIVISLLKPKALSMSDGERLKTLMDLYDKSKQLKSQVARYRYSIIECIR